MATNDTRNPVHSLLERFAVDTEAAAARVAHEAMLRGVARGIEEAMPLMLATIQEALNGALGAPAVVAREAAPVPHGASSAKAAQAPAVAVAEQPPTPPALEMRPELRQADVSPVAPAPKGVGKKPTDKPYFTDGQARGIMRVKGQRRSADQMAKLESAALYIISKHPGLRAEELAPLVGLPPAELRDVFVRLVDSSRISTTGAKHGVRYYPTPAS